MPTQLTVLSARISPAISASFLTRVQPFSLAHSSQIPIIEQVVPHLTAEQVKAMQEEQNKKLLAPVRAEVAALAEQLSPEVALLKRSLEIAQKHIRTLITKNDALSARVHELEERSMALPPK